MHEYASERFATDKTSRVRIENDARHRRCFHLYHNFGENIRNHCIVVFLSILLYAWHICKRAFLSGVFAEYKVEKIGVRDGHFEKNTTVRSRNRREGKREEKER